MFKLSSDHLANFRGIQTYLSELASKVGDIYNRLVKVEREIRGISPGLSLPINAEDVDYDNGTSGLTATDVQAAIDELAASGGGGGSSNSFLDLGKCGAVSNYTVSNSCKTLMNTASGGASHMLSYQFFGGDGGKYYFEVLVDDDQSNLGVGVITREQYISAGYNYVGGQVSSWGYWHSGAKMTLAATTGGYPTFTDGDVIGVAVDTSTGKIWFAKNNTWIEGDPAAGTSASYTNTSRLVSQLHIYVSPYATNAKATIRGLTSEFSYSPPTGFVAAFD